MSETPEMDRFCRSEIGFGQKQRTANSYSSLSSEESSSGFEIMDPDWANLPEELLDSVVERLASPSDYLQFSCVCKSWSSVAKINKSQALQMISPTPMLLIPANKKHTWYSYRVMDKKILNFQISVPDEHCGYSKGWFITVEKNCTVVLINPFFRVKGKGKEKENSIIRLPPLTFNPISRRRWVEVYGVKAMISADPILNATDCIVVIIYERLQQMAFIRPSKDTTWTYIDIKTDDQRWRYVLDATYFQDRFYVVDFWDRLKSFDTTVESNSAMKVVAENIKSMNINQKYFVISNEKELLMVQRLINVIGWIHLTIGFKVFELNFDKSEWVEKNDLGDVALFLGDYSSISVATSNVSGCQSNSIYFFYDKNDNCNGRLHDNGVNYVNSRYYDYGVYDVKSKTITHYDTPVLKKVDRPAIWVLPTFQL